MSSKGFWVDLGDAVAFRITEMDGIPSSLARERVRDFITYGLQSEHHTQVLRATYDIFNPLLASVAPFLRAAVQQGIIEVQSQNERGREAEEHHEGKP